MSGLLDKLKKQLEGELEEEVIKRIQPIAKTLDEILKVQREQLKVLNEILEAVKGEQKRG